MQNPGNALPSLAVRGAMWGACLIPAAWYFWKPEWVVMLPIMTALFPAAALLARTPVQSPVDYDTWAFMEFLRGTMVGTAAFLVGLLL